MLRSFLSLSLTKTCPGVEVYLYAKLITESPSYVTIRRPGLYVCTCWSGVLHLSTLILIEVACRLSLDLWVSFGENRSVWILSLIDITNLNLSLCHHRFSQEPGPGLYWAPPGFDYFLDFRWAHSQETPYIDLAPRDIALFWPGFEAPPIWDSCQLTILT